MCLPTDTNTLHHLHRIQPKLLNSNIHTYIVIIIRNQFSRAHYHFLSFLKRSPRLCDLIRLLLQARAFLACVPRLLS